MLLRLITAGFAISMLGTAAYAQSNSPTTLPESVRSTADGAANPECVTNPNIPDHVAVASAKCMIARKMDVNGKLGPVNGNSVALPGSKPGPLPSAH